MEGSVCASADHRSLIDGDDVNYLSGLSTILVATIQEVKDRVSQIEYIFCSQLYPNFQSRSLSLQKKFGEAMKAAEDDWRKKEDSLLRQLKELQHEKQQVLEQNRLLFDSLEQMKGKLVDEETRKTAENEWRKEERRLLLKIDELQQAKHQVVDEKNNLFDCLEKEKEKLNLHERLLNEHEKQKDLLLAKLEKLENNVEVDELRKQLKIKMEEWYEEKKMVSKLQKEKELKDYDILAEKKKQRDLVDSYKRLKSQHNFLLAKLRYNAENQLCACKMAEQINFPRPHLSPEPEDKYEHTSGLGAKINEPKNETNLQIHEGERFRKAMNSDSTFKYPSASTSSRPPSFPTSPKSEPLAGHKRPISCWRDTRLQKESSRADPHDDFLDTPTENIRENLNKTLKEEAEDYPGPSPQKVDFDSSDDETQNINGESVPQQQQISITKPEGKGFKYIETAKKKADRENLKGFECRQCKKFYDAVLPHEKNGVDNNNGNTNFRCEHHDGVSRHRYRYAPPMTPEGFWNIGFDSDI
ncbi:hypothetical protein Scep_014242 [Stephania cephalantha]|uniref:DNA endonuclease activator Ctp1 C-terminal domain-containing protein n=1 Tax=Stephania cephalantha TaxID=152367 RepID=A0AAP0P2T9_9MAGN